MEILRETLGSQGILTVTLHRPEVKNALDEHLIEALSQTLERVRKTNQVRVLVLKGSAGFFCAGADLGWMKRLSTYSRTENIEDARALAHLLRLLDDFPCPTVAVVEGGAFGGGVGLVAACDIALATETAIFSLSEVRLGLVPAVISPYIVNAMGERCAKKLTLTAERFSSHEALERGLVHQVVSSQALAQEEEKLMAQLIKGGPMAQKKAKELFKLVAREKNTERLMDATATVIADVRASTEGREGVSAFLEKRNPMWIGDSL